MVDIHIAPFFEYLCALRKPPMSNVTCDELEPLEKMLMRKPKKARVGPAPGAEEERNLVLWRWLDVLRAFGESSSAMIMYHSEELGIRRGKVEEPGGPFL